MSDEERGPDHGTGVGLSPDIAGGNRWLKRLLPLLILALGVAGTILLVRSRRPPARKARPKVALLVETFVAHPERRQVEVVSNGVVQPSREVGIVPEVSGRIRTLNPQLVVGGMIRRGALMVAIDPADFKLALEKGRAQVAQAERSLAMAESSARVARSEWKRVGQQSGGGKGSPLTLHEPQLREAQAMLAAARADLAMAQLSLQRTSIRAPFNLRVRSEAVEVGQYVRVGQEIAKVYGTDLVEVVVPLPVTELRWLKIPQARGEEGSAVTVRLKTGEAIHTRKGRLVRSVGEVDSTGRMSKVVVAVEDPYNLKHQEGGYRLAFEIGSFVEVALDGRVLERVFPIPAEALRRGSRVWVAAAGDKLQMREVVAARVTDKEALILSGLSPGDRVVLSTITGAVEGMQLRVRAERAGKPVAQGEHGR